MLLWCMCSLVAGAVPRQTFSQWFALQQQSRTLMCYRTRYPCLQPDYIPMPTHMAQALIMGKDAGSRRWPVNIVSGAETTVNVYIDRTPRPAITPSIATQHPAVTWRAITLETQSATTTASRLPHCPMPLGAVISWIEARMTQRPQKQTLQEPALPQNPLLV